MLLEDALVVTEELRPHIRQHARRWTSSGKADRSRDLDDIEQDTYFIALRVMEKYPGQTKDQYRSLVFSAVRNAVRDHFRRTSRYLDHLYVLAADPNYTEGAEPVIGEAVAEEARAKMSEIEREVFKLMRLGWRVTDIATYLGYDKGWVSRLCGRVIKILETVG